MKYFKYLLLVIVVSCSKDEIVPDIDITNPVDCIIDYSTLQNGINRLTSHYQPNNIPFTDYADKLNISLPIFGSYSLFSAYGDFNNNDIPDYAVAATDWRDTSSNEVVIVIDNQIAFAFSNPQTLTRKISISDLNEDGIDDIVMFGTGEDVGNSPGDKTHIIVMGVNSYQLIEVGKNSGYIHTGAVGYINGTSNSILEIDSQAFTKDKEEFVKYYTSDNSISWNQYETNISNYYVASTYQSELYDFDNDGILDLILGGHEWEEEWHSSALGFVQWRTNIVGGLGNGQFDIDNPIILPSIENWGVITDFDMYDIDNDGSTEIIITRTTGRPGVTSVLIDDVFYDGIMVQILKGNGSNWYEWKRLQQPVAIVGPSLHMVWAYSTLIYDVNKDCLLDIIPESDKINAKSFTNFNILRGFYYEQQTDGSFVIKYKG